MTLADHPHLPCTCSTLQGIGRFFVSYLLCTVIIFEEIEIIIILRPKKLQKEYLDLVRIQGTGLSPDWAGAERSKVPVRHT
jgi:hypothetical protein